MLASAARLSHHWLSILKLYGEGTGMKYAGCNSLSWHTRLHVRALTRALPDNRLIRCTYEIWLSFDLASAVAMAST